MYLLSFPVGFLVGRNKSFAILWEFEYLARHKSNRTKKGRDVFGIWEPGIQMPTIKIKFFVWFGL